MESLATTLAPAPAPAPRPFSPGAVIGRSFSTWFANLVPFSIVTLTVNLPVFLLAALAPDEERPELDRLQMFVSSLADLIVIGALTHGVLQALNGTAAPLGALFRRGFTRWGPVARVSIAYALLVFLGLGLLVVPGVIAACVWYVAIPAVVVEDRGAFAALARSRALTKGSRWAVLVVALVVFAVTVATGAASAAVGTFAPALPHPVAPLLATAIGALVTPLGACAAAVAYHDLRVAKEGVDTAALVKVFE
ncbi:MAG TPA: hypothetical protein VF841_18215 [Anaeromyxobacter sp.]